jgi:hypothetical protein
MPAFQRIRANRLLPSTMLFALIVNALCAQPSKVQIASSLKTRDVEIEVSAGGHSPSLRWLVTPAGRVLHNQQEETLPASVEVDGSTVPLQWRIKPKERMLDAHRIVFVYESARPHLRLTWEWIARAHFGPIEHSIIIQNLSKQDVWLPMVNSLELNWSIPADVDLRNFYAEKGADTPSAQGTHLDDVRDGYHWTGKSSTYAFPAPGEPREIIPLELVFNAEDSQAGWYAGIEFSGRTRISLERNISSLRTVLGLNPEPGPFRSRLKAGGSFVTPRIFLGAFSGGPDGAGNQLRPWVRAVLGNPATWRDPQYPLTVNNSWGSGMLVDEGIALRMIAESKELGLEMFHLDAGWFRGVGDWYPNTTKFPHGLAYVADAAHKRGLRFGLWVDWSQAGLDTEPGALNVNDPKVQDWLVTDVPAEWKPEEFKGKTVDMSVPAARDYLQGEIKRIVDSYHLDMLEHDGYLVAEGCTRDNHPHAPPDRSTMKVIHDWGSDFVQASNSTDVSYHAVRAYYDIYDRTRREHPRLLFEICNDGGRMIDFGSAAHGDYFSITDTYDPLSNRRAFYDTSYFLPAAMLESYVDKWPTPQRENLLYMLRSGMMGWFTLMFDTAAWSPEQHQTAQESIAVYKTKLRPLIRDASIYHISARPDGVHWDGMEFWDSTNRRGVLFAFRGSILDEANHRFDLAGLKSTKRYGLHFEDGTAPDAEIEGAELMSRGLEIHLANPLSSELVFLVELGNAQSEIRR